MGFRIAGIAAATPGVNAYGRSVGPDEFIDFLEETYSNGSGCTLGMLERLAAKRLARIQARSTGIERRDLLVTDKVELKSIYLAALSLSRALNEYKIKPQQLDGIIYCSKTPDLIHPSEGLVVANLLGIDLRGKQYATVALDCASIEKAISHAVDWIQDGRCEKVAIVTGDINSRLSLPLNDRTAYLFGDQFVTVILESFDEGGILTTGVSADTTMAGALINRSSYSGDPVSVEHAQIQGLANDRGLGTLGIWESQIWPWLAHNLVRQGVVVDKDTVIIGPQATKKVYEEGLDGSRKNYGLDIEHNALPPASYRHGNTGAAAYPLALCEGWQRSIKPTTKIIMIFAGVGGMFGTLVFDPKAKEIRRPLSIEIDARFPNAKELVEKREQDPEVALSKLLEGLYCRINPPPELGDYRALSIHNQLEKIHSLLQAHGDDYLVAI